MKKLILLVVLVFVFSSVASASIITNVDREYGRSGDKAPIGVFNGGTEPLPMESGNLKDGNYAYSDRTYPLVDVAAGLIGSEYIRTFNNDKDSKEINVSYMVTIGEDAYLWIAIDDRVPGEVGEMNSQMEAVELATYRLPCDIEFFDTGMDVGIREASDGSKDRPLSVYATTELVPAGTYDFGLHPTGKNFYLIGAVPEPATIALLGLGGLALIRRKKR